MTRLNDIVDKGLLKAFATRLMKKNINVFPLYDDLEINLDGVEECEK